MLFCIGVSGAGKSFCARRDAKAYLAENNIDEEPYHLMLPVDKNDKVWWENYNGESVVIINEFYGQININQFKDLVSEDPTTVNVKNSSAPFLAKRIYITSNAGWKTWWAEELLKNKENSWAIERRITKLQHFETPYKPINSDEPILYMGDPTDEEFNLVRSDAMLVGQNTLNELFCDEEQEFLDQCYYGNGEHNL